MVAVHDGTENIYIRSVINVKCVNCMNCTKAERMFWTDYENDRVESEWMFYCELEGWLTENVAMKGECPQYDKDRDDDTKA